MRRSRLSQYKQNKLIELFVAGVTARTAAQLVGVNKNTAAYYFHRLQLLIFHSSPHLEMFDGEVEADESYFGGHRKGRRGRGAAGKVAVFGLLKRNGKVYTVAVPNTQTATLLPIIRDLCKIPQKSPKFPPRHLGDFHEHLLPANRTSHDRQTHRPLPTIEVGSSD